MNIEQTLQQAIIHHQADEPLVAEQLYRAILTEEPKHPDANHNLGLLMMQQDQTDDALAFFTNALNANPNAIQFWVSYIDALIYTAQFDVAENILKLGRSNGLEGAAFDQLDIILASAIEKTQLTSLQAEIDSVLALYANGQIQETLTDLQGLHITYPDTAIFYNLSGACYMDLGQPDIAVKHYQQALDIKPDYAEAYSNLGVAFKDLGQLDAAIKNLKQALVIEPDYTPAHYNLGNVFNDLDDPDAAIKSFKKALSITPYYVEAHFNLGNVFRKHKQLDAAIKSYDQVLSINANHTEAHYNLGIIYNNLGQSDSAVKHYTQALEIKPDYAEAHYNLGIIFNDLGQLDKAVKHYRRALEINPNYVEAHYNLGIIFNGLGQMDTAVKHYRRALEINPNYVEAYSNLGVTLKELGQLDAAVKTFEKVLVINPNYAEAYSNLGNTFKDLGQLEAAIKSYEKARAIKPDFAEAHSNLGCALYDLGQLDAAMKSYERAIAIDPELVDAWDNLYFTAKPLTNMEPIKGGWLTSFKEKMSTTILNNLDFAILDFKLNAFKPHSVEGSFNCAVNALPSIKAEEINNPENIHQLDNSIQIPQKLIALIHFGRSGTGLLHSLIDNHPEISTLPSIYFTKYFNPSVWKNLTANGWETLPEIFITQFSVLFDARSSMPVQSTDNHRTSLGEIEGMTTLGMNRDEVLMVDKHVFCSELKQLMASYSKLNLQTFFVLVHVAYERTLMNNEKKHTIFYHIHNPSPYAKLNFLRYNPESRLIMIVREPIQSCESWIRGSFNSKAINDVRYLIITMLFGFDQIAFRTQDSIGVRLEDLKTHPKETMSALCDWMGIKEETSLYEMTAQGKKWWGDPSSPDYGKEAMSPFGDSSIKRTVGSIFSEKDQYILRVLFYPFSVRFGYITEDIEAFKADLQIIKPLLHEPFDFEKKLATLSDISIETFLESGSSLYFRSGLQDRWDVLNEFNDYPHMLEPLVIQES